MMDATRSAGNLPGRRGTLPLEEIRAVQSRLLAHCAGCRHGFAADGRGAPVRGAKIWRPRQVHGSRILRPLSASEPTSEADGAVGTPGGPAVGVVTADCVPLLMAAVDGSAVAAVHAGWRGIAAGIVERAVEDVRVLARGAELRAALGPAAGGCCYEVGDQVLDALGPPAPAVTPTRTGHARLDLRAVVGERLRRSGLARGSIENVGPCTICSPEWPSYRRQGAAAGRLLAWIAGRAEGSRA